jgi:prepilin-type N-terminal cleavage/methylation domain-containing protein
MQRTESGSGFTLLELLVVVAIIGIIANMSCGLLMRAMRRTALRQAAVALDKLMRRVQYDASGNSASRGLRFSPGASGWQYAVYEDGDGDGVLSADIAAGIDPLIESPQPLVGRLSTAGIGVPEPPVEHPDDGKSFSTSMKAVNFNQSFICSFAPDGDATPGTIYLVNGTTGEAAMVRSSGEGGQIRTLFYGLGGKGWQP